MEYWAHIFVMAAIFTILALSLDLVVGHLGLFSVAHAAFFAIGAYASGLLTARWAMPFPIGLSGGIIIAVIASLAISLPSARLRDEHFIIATFGFQMIVFSLLNNSIELTRGPLGLPGIPRPSLLGWGMESGLAFCGLAGCLAALCFFLNYRLVSSPFGRVLHAIREDEAFAAACGKNSLYFKTVTFAVSAGMSSLAGSLYAHFTSYIDPSSFTVMDSILLISMLMIGGAGSVLGAVAGAVILVTLPEVLRFVGMPEQFAANLRHALFGVALVIILIWRPNGLFGNKSRNR